MLGVILWVTDFLIFFLDRWSFVAVTVVCLLYTCVMAAAFVNSRAIYMKEMADYAREFQSLETLLLR